MDNTKNNLNNYQQTYLEDSHSDEYCSGGDEPIIFHTTSTPNQEAQDQGLKLSQSNRHRHLARQSSSEDDEFHTINNHHHRELTTSSSPMSIITPGTTPDTHDELSSTPTESTSFPPKGRRKKKKRLMESLSVTTFKDIYYLTGDVLGEGSYGRVETCVNIFTDVEFAVKIISKSNWCFSRSKVLKEIELYYLCQGQKEIIQLIEYFEEADFFYLIFEKAYGGPLLSQIQRRVHFSEEEAVTIVKDLAHALRFLHERGIAHRDLKPENILCIDANAPNPIKLCDFDLCSSVNQTMSTPLLQSPVGSAEYMAPEVVNAFAVLNFDDDDDEFTYDKRCDLWSLGVIAYILLCGYLPFVGHCDNDCGWDEGEECPQCQKSLFDAITGGKLVFPSQHWDRISPEAKDLISKLLVKEASQRLDANSVLNHQWIVKGGSSAKNLETPAILRRQTSVKEISEMATNAMAIKRNFESPMISFSRAFNPNNNTSSINTTTSTQWAVMENSNNVIKNNKKQQQRRKTSAQVTSSTGNFRNMRRQTSLIFPERVSSFFNRCEMY